MHVCVIVILSLSTQKCVCYVCYLGRRRWHIVDHSFNGSADTARQSSRPYHSVGDVFTDSRDCHLGAVDHLLSALG